MSKPDNKQFKVVWEVHLDRSYIESLCPPNSTEYTVQDIVFIESLGRMQNGDPSLVYWMDEDNEEIHRLSGHHTEGVVAGVAEPVEFPEVTWDEDEEEKL